MFGQRNKFVRFTFAASAALGTMLLAAGTGQAAEGEHIEWNSIYPNGVYERGQVSTSPDGRTCERQMNALRRFDEERDPDREVRSYSCTRHGDIWVLSRL